MNFSIIHSISSVLWGKIFGPFVRQTACIARLTALCRHKEVSGRQEGGIVFIATLKDINK